MRIFVRTSEGRRFWIPAPLWILKLGTGTWVEKIISKYVPEEQRQYLDCIDFSKLHNSIDVLREYKGMEIVDVKVKDGTVVNIRL